MKTFTNLAHRALKKCASLGTANRNRYYLFTIIMLLTLGVGNVWGAEATINFSEKGLENGVQYLDPFTIDANTTITFAGGGNDGKYYDTGTGIRTYGDGTITVECTNGTISEISFTWSGSYKPAADVAAPVGYSTSTGKWTGSASSVTLTRPSGSGHWRLQEVTVTYETAGGGETPDPTPTQLAAPTGLTVDDITSSGATLSWNVVEHASSYSVTVVDGESFSQSYSVTETTKTVSGLTPSTDYLWTVTAVGDGTNYTNSEESETGEFTTSAPAGGGEGDGEETWTLVTNASDLKVGDEVVIAASGYDYAMASQNGNYRNRISITKEGNNITINNDVQILTIEEGTESNTYAFNTGSGYLYACSSSNNYLKTQTTNNENGSWTITITNTGEATLVAQGSFTRNMIQYNATSGSERFSCYATDKPQKPVSIYKKVTSSGGSEPEPVIVKTLKSIEVTGMTTTFEQGDVFKFDGTCTATYSVTKDGVDEADETSEVTPTSVLAPDMNTIGKQTVTVTYSEGGVEKTDDYEITITENTVTAGEYCIAPNNEFWGTNFNGSLSGEALDQTYTGRQDDITIQYAKGSGSNLYINASQTRTYSGTTLTFSVPSGYLITAIAFTADGNNWAGTHTANVGSMTDSKTWAGSANEVTITFGGTCRITKICVTYEAIDLTLPSAPTFNPEAGTYNTVQNVTISAEAGTTIYYTLDGTDPTTKSNVYSTPIEIAETKTLKAIAVKDEKVSHVASATYTIKLPLTTMDQIFAKATAVGSTATSVEITFGNWVVSAVKEDGKTAFVTDGTKGFVIFDKYVNLGFSVGNILSGTATCKVQLYNGFAELTELKSNTVGLSVGSGGTITTQELDAAGIAALTGVNTGSLIKINGICTQSGSNYYVAGVQVYSSLYAFGTLEVGAEYNITGIYQQYNATKEMLPRSAEDIEEVVGLPTATIEVSNITMEVGQEKAIEATITPDAAQSTVQYSITAGSEFIDLNGTTITAIAAGTATITATIAEVAGEYKGATKTFSVTVKPQNIAILPFAFNGGKTDVENTLGMSHNDLDDDYNSAPKLKFNGAGDNVIIHFDSQAGDFSFLLKQNGQNAGTFTVYESANGEDYTSVWAGGDFGNAQSETIKPALSESARYVKFEYTTKGNSTNYALGSISIAKPDFRQEAGLAWDPSSVTLTQGDAFTAPTLQNPKSVAGITYESSNGEVATVTAEGEIALATSIGTATITATFAGDGTYKPATATCTITVNEYIETIDGEWELVTDASKLQAGMEIIIASVEVDGKYYAMSKASDNGNNRTAVESTISGEKLNPAVGTSVLTLVDAGNGTFALQAGNGKYLYAASSTSNHLKEKDKIDVNGQWTITIADSKATIKAEASSNRNWIRYNNSSNMFSCYASGQKDIALYAKKPAESRTTSAGRYGTVCLPGNIVKCLGATLYEVAGKDGLRVVFDEVLTPEAGMPYIFLAHNAEVLFYCGDQTAATPGDHKSLHGTFTVLQNSELEGMYMVQNNKIVECNPANSGVAAYRAYFNGTELEALGSAPAPMPGRRRITMGTESENTTTGTEDVVAPEGQTLKLIENGQLIIIRNGEKFNAQGIKF